MEHHWKYYPALKLALPYAAGIVFGQLIAPPAEILVGLAACGLWWLGLAVCRDGLMLAPPLALLLVTSGALMLVSRAPDTLELAQGFAFDDCEIQGHVQEPPLFRSGHVEFTMACNRFAVRNSVCHVRTHAIVRLYDTTPFDPRLLPRAGERVGIVGRVVIPDAPANPGAFDASAYYRSVGVGAIVSVRRAGAIYCLGGDERTAIQRLVGDVRQAVADFAERYVGGEEGDIVLALLTGERRLIDPATTEAYSRTGTVHLLSVSGLHVGVVALVLFVLVAWLPWRWLQTAIFIVVISFYVVIAGVGPAIVRAALMATTYMIARTAGRRANPLNTLGVAGLVLLAADPVQLFDIGFQLSFASVAGLILFAAPAWRWLGVAVPMLAGRARSVGRMCAVSAAAQGATTPLVAHYFGYLPLTASLVNLPVVPMYSVALASGLAGAVAAPISSDFAVWFGTSARVLVQWATAMIQWAAGVPLSGMPMAGLGLIGSLLLGGMLVYLAFSRSAAQAATRLVALACAVVCIAMGERLLDPLNSNHHYLVLMVGRDGVLPAWVTPDSAIVFTHRGAGDSLAIAQAVRGLFLRVGPRHVRYSRADTVLPDSPDVYYMNSRPAESVLRCAPVLLTNTSSPGLRMACVGNSALLVVPLRMRERAAIVLRWEPDGFVPVNW